MEPNYKNICILLFDEKCTDGHKVINNGCITFPKKCKIVKDFNGCVIGEAFNFRIEENKILCDLFIKDTMYKTIAPSILGTIDNDNNTIMSKLNYLAVIARHAIDKLNDNLLQEGK